MNHIAVVLQTMDNLTKTVGTYIRDALRNDSSLCTTLGITTATAKNYIFLGTPVRQNTGFENPRITIIPKPSDPGQLAYTGIYQGIEAFQINVWVDETPFDVVLDTLDRIVTLFNKTAYTMTGNMGEFRVSNKFSFKDPDKINTTKGELTITLSIGGAQL